MRQRYIMSISCSKVFVDVHHEEIDTCGHWVAEEQPEYLTQKLLRFFAEGD